MNQRQLEIFITLAETLNFTKTAEQLFLAQTTVTLQIRNLEEELSARLFERSSRSVSLTYAGQVFYKGAKELLEKMELLEKQTADAAKGYIGQLRIGFADDVNATGIASLVKSFTNDHPEIKLYAHGGYPEALWDQVMSEQYDVIFTPSFRKLREEKLEVLHLGQYRTVAAFMKDHRFSKKEALTFQDFEGESFIYVSGEHEELDFSRDFFHALQQQGVHISIFDRIDNIDSVFMLLDAEQGITVLPEYFTGRFFGTSEIQTRPIAENLPLTDYVAVWKPGKHTKAVDSFLEYMKDFFSAGRK